jgi:hypothetical protein
VGDEGAKRLLERLEADGAHPLWLATPGWNVSGGVIPSFLASSLGGQAEAMSARGDIHSVAKMIQLAKEYTGGSGSLFWTAAIFQAALICACPYLDPRLMVVFAAFPALFMLGRGSDS